MIATATPITSLETAWPSLGALHDCLGKPGGVNVRIAVLDSGVETSHPQLAGLELADDLAVEDDGVALRVEPGAGVDRFGHGTAVAWTIRQLAPAATIGSFRVLGARNTARDVAICEGVRLALERGYHILNCSFGSRSLDRLPLYKSWVDEAYIRGVHIIAACNNDDYDRMEWPGHFPTVITVNMARTAEDAALFYKPGRLVEFAARGLRLTVPWRDGRTIETQGSSFAAPRVAGLLARLLSEHPGLSPLEAKAALRRLATPWNQAVAGPNVTYTV